MKKKIILSTLLIGSVVSILPLSFVFNNKNYVAKEDENKTTNETMQTADVLNDNTTLENNVFRDEDYNSMFINNLTRPVISPNTSVPGFLGASKIDGTQGVFPTSIGWTSVNLWQSWSVNLNDHPSLKGQTPTGFAPGLVTALYSDTVDSTVQRNQIFAIVANTANLNARDYWILRYNALDGSPILDANSKMPKMTNAPLPQLTASNGNGSAFALTNDTFNDRYISFYPGRLGDLKKDIFAFSINDNNKIVYQENLVDFGGHSNWDTSAIEYKDNNIVMGLVPLGTTDANKYEGSIALMLATEAGADYNFRAINLKKDFGATPNFTSKIITSRKAGDFSSEQGIIAVPKSLLTITTIQRDINPHLQYIDMGSNNYKIQMVLTILKGDNYIFMYLSGINDKDNGNSYMTTWSDSGDISQGSFFSSFAVNPFPGQPAMAPNIAYDDFDRDKIIITAQTGATNATSFTGIEFRFTKTPPSGSWNPMRLILGEFNTTGNNNWPGRNIVVRCTDGYVGAESVNNNNNKVYFWSSLSGNARAFTVVTSSVTIQELASVRTGGIYHERFQTTASNLQWLLGQTNAKLPSEITNEELTKIGTGVGNFFRHPVLEYPTGLTHQLALAIEGQVVRDDRNGIIQGVFNLTQELTLSALDNLLYKFSLKIPFKVTGLKVSSDVPTSIVQNSSILDNLPSELTPENVPNFIDILAVPPPPIVVATNNWLITNPDNAAGTATVSVDVNPHYNDSGVQVDGAKTFTTNVTGLKTISGTTATKSTTSGEDLTVWDVTEINASRFIQIINLIPGSPANTIAYSVINQEPLLGTLTIKISIPSGSYYDPANKGLPSVVGGAVLELDVIVDGFKTILDTGTTITPRIGPFIGIFPSFINETNAGDFIDITNAVPGSKYEITDVINTSITGEASFNVTFDKIYNTLGNILAGTPVPIKISGLQDGQGTKDTMVFSTQDTTLFNNTLPPEINESNIRQFLIPINVPPNATITYKFTGQSNVGAPNTGFQKVDVTFSEHYDASGNLVNQPNTKPITISDLKTINGATSVTSLSGTSNTLPQFISQFDIDRFYRINNPSPILDKPTSIQIEQNSFITNNFNGTVSFRYKIINSIQNFEFIPETNFTLLTISGFERGAVTNITSAGELSTIKASEFVLNETNFLEYAKFTGYTVNEVNEDGVLSGTAVTSITKTGSSDENGTATFVATVIGGAINKEGIFNTAPIEITFTLEGFEVVTTNMLPIIIGAVGGGLGFIILVVVGIIVFNNIKNKKILNEKKPVTKSGPPTPPGSGRPAAPPPGMARASAPPAPGMARPAAPPAPGMARPTAPPAPGMARPTAPPAPGMARPTAPPPRR